MPPLTRGTLCAAERSVRAGATGNPVAEPAVIPFQTVHHLAIQQKQHRWQCRDAPPPSQGRIALVLHGNQLKRIAGQLFAGASPIQHVLAALMVTLPEDRQRRQVEFLQLEIEQLLFRRQANQGRPSSPIAG